MNIQGTYNNDKLMQDVNNTYTNYLIRNLPKAKTNTKVSKSEAKYDIKEGATKTNKAVNDVTNKYYEWLISQAPKKEELTNKIYKGLNNTTKGTYYDNKGHILFQNGQLTGLGKEVFDKDSNRAEWNYHHIDIQKQGYNHGIHFQNEYLPKCRQRPHIHYGVPYNT